MKIRFNRSVFDSEAILENRLVVRPGGREERISVLRGRISGKGISTLRAYFSNRSPF